MGKFLRFSAWTLFLIAALIFVLRLTAIRWWQIPNGDPYLEASLAPSLRAGDWIVLWRATAPLEGNLVLCPEPKAPERPVIGRIVAEANDHVQLGPRGLLVNQHPFETESSCDKFSVIDPGTHQLVEQSCRREIVGSQTHPRGEPKPELPLPQEAELDVPQGNVFLVSDNRQFPWDSREFGLVPRDTCRETVLFRLMSKDGFFDVANRFNLIR